MPDHQIQSSKLKTIRYQEFPPYSTTVIQAKFENPTYLESDNNMVLKTRSAFIDNNTNLKCYPTLINKTHQTIMQHPQ